MVRNAMLQVLHHPVGSLASGATGLTLLDATPPAQNSGELILKAVLALISALPGLIQLFKKGGTKKVKK